MNTPLDCTNFCPGALVESTAAMPMRSYTSRLGPCEGFASCCEHTFMLDFWVSCVPPGESSHAPPSLFSPFSRRRYQ